MVPQTEPYTKFENGMEVHRIGRRIRISRMYAPEGKAAIYFVHSQINTIWVDGFLCVMGYVIDFNGKPTRIWMQ